MACVIHSATRCGPIVPHEVSLEGNVLMPDDCLGFEDPMLAEALYPAKSFDLPQLRRLPDGFCERQALFTLGIVLSKSCAGLPERHRSTPEAVREAFLSGRFGEREGTCLHWSLPGLRAQQFLALAGKCGIPLFHLVRGLWALYGHGQLPHAPWLNQWARNPNRSLPNGESAGALRKHYRRAWARALHTESDVLFVPEGSDLATASVRADGMGLGMVLVHEGVDAPCIGTLRDPPIKPPEEMPDPEPLEVGGDEAELSEAPAP